MVLANSQFLERASHCISSWWKAEGGVAHVEQVEHVGQVGGVASLCNNLFSL
jgi:hypothetical protein